jgi:hypothetical protein
MTAIPVVKKCAPRLFALMMMPIFWQSGVLFDSHNPGENSPNYHHGGYAHALLIGSVPHLQQQSAERIIVYTNPARQSLRPGDQALLSVSDNWLYADLTWHMRTVSGDLFGPGELSAEKESFVVYKAPSGWGTVEITVDGVQGNRVGQGVIQIRIDPWRSD